MSFQVVCVCGRKLKLSDQFRGRKIQCFCKRRYRVSEDASPTLKPLESLTESKSSSPIEVKTDQTIPASSEASLEIESLQMEPIEGSLPTEAMSPPPPTQAAADPTLEPVPPNPMMVEKPEQDVFSPPELKKNPGGSLPEQSEPVLPVNAKDPLSFDEVANSGGREDTGVFHADNSPLAALKQQRGMKIIHQARVYTQFKEGWFHCYLTSEDKKVWGYSGMEEKEVKSARGLGIILGIVVLFALVIIFRSIGLSAIGGFILAFLIAFIVYFALFSWKRAYGYLILFRDSERAEKSMEIIQRTKFPFPFCSFEVNDPSNELIGTLRMNYLTGVLHLLDECDKEVAYVRSRTKYGGIQSALIGKWFFVARNGYAIFAPNAPLPFGNFDAFIEEKDYGRLEIGAPGSSIDPRLFHALILMLEYDR